MRPEELILRNLESEVTFNATRSSGPGGQNVNKVNTRIELRFNIYRSQLLSDSEKSLISAKLVNRISDLGDLIIISQSERSQLENKKRALKKFYELLAGALTKRKKRIPTLPGQGSVAKRLDEKRKRSGIKKMRANPDKSNPD